MRLLAALVAALALTSQAPAPSRAIVVIGDLHMGPGRDDAGRWHPYEDFRWRDEFIGFLDALNAEGGDLDLVINGDLFELLQSPHVPCENRDARLGCTVEAAAERLALAIKAHGPELAAIGMLAATGSNRVHVIPGDHDAALLLPELWQQVVTAIRAPSGRLLPATEGRWRSEDGRVHIEHGHQLPLSAERFSNWPNPIVTADGRRHIERPWGEQAIAPFYDRAEPRYPIVDNIAEEGVGAKFAAAADPAAVIDAAALLKFLLTRTTWQQFRMDLDDGDVQAPGWDLKRIRGEGAAFMAASLPADDPYTATVKTIAVDSLSAVAGVLSDQQIVAICDYRAALRRARRRMERVLTQLSGVGAPMLECPRLPDTVGPAFEYYWRSRDEQVKAHVPAMNLDVIVFGHTHLMDRPFRPMGEAGPVVVTSGAWQRTILPVDLKQIDAPVESLAPCYAFLQIGAAKGAPVPQARSWVADDRRQWAMRTGGC